MVMGEISIKLFKKVMKVTTKMIENMPILNALYLFLISAITYLIMTQSIEME